MRPVYSVALRRAALAPLLALLLGACASVAPIVEPHPADPWEASNRQVFAFNAALDRRLVKPVAQAYTAVVPEPLRDALGNVIANLEDAWSALNWALQGEFRRAAGQGARFAWNSSLGLGGLFNVAHALGLERERQDFGQTLGVWGLGLGPYVVLPILGPSSLRDTAALPFNLLASGSSHLSDTPSRLGAAALELTHQRASFFAAERVIDGIALDRYTFLRDAYLQRRAAPPVPRDAAGFEPAPERDVGARDRPASPR